MSDIDWQHFGKEIEAWSRAEGFNAVGITDLELAQHEDYLNAWLERDFHGSMSYMSRHGTMRSHPEQLHPGSISVISLRIDYLSQEPEPITVLQNQNSAYISRYALGRDYHKVLRGKLKKIIALMEEYLRCHNLDKNLDNDFDNFDARVFTDSAPLLEKAIAEKAGLGWIGKNTLLLSEEAGSWFFLGEILTNLPLLPLQSAKVVNRCGSCSACMDICPTQALVGPYQLDARRCISYLTIEHKGAIPVALRPLLGNRIFGCDDCQLVCPWNRYAQTHRESDFKPRHGLEDAQLMDLFAWSEQEFLTKTQGSAIRRTGYEGWLRNLAIALGNAPFDPDIVASLNRRLGKFSTLVDEHIHWALEQHLEKHLAEQQTANEEALS